VTTIPLICQCGSVTGEVRNVSPKTGFHVACHCESCQAFPNHIGAGDRTLDPHGGTAIYQTNPAQLSFHTGSEHLKCLRLTPKGAYRWYAGCCNTPIGNTRDGKLPFVGLIHTIMGEGSKAATGPVTLHVQTQDALPGLPTELQNEGFPKEMRKKAMRKILWWKITGKARPNPFFNKDGSPVSEPEIINP